MSETAIIVNTVVGAVVAMFTGVMAYQTLKLNLKAKDAATKVEEVSQQAKVAAVEVVHVKEALAETTNIVTSQLKDIHTLVNSQMGDQKRLLATTARAKAIITNERADIEAADRAEQELREHERKQAKVDDKNGA